MRIAAIYDIHGNLRALEAVLNEIRLERVDLVLVGGDIVPGPMPADSLEMLRNLDIPTRFIQGNGDRAVSETKAGVVTDAVPERFRPMLLWCAEQLTEEQCSFLGALPATLRIENAGIGDVLFCHATPRNDTEIFTRQTAGELLQPVFEGVNAAVVVCGHTHMQFDRKVGASRVVNAGSVGAPYGEPGAYWLLLGPDIEFRRSSYDLNVAAATVRTTDYPARDICAASILSPTPEEEMLRLFAGAELK